MRKLLLIILFLPLFVSARKFYVSSSTGSDSYTFLQAQNPATPWKSLKTITAFGSSLNNGFQQFTTYPNKAAAGDTFVFKRGDLFDNGETYYSSFFWINYTPDGYSCPSGTALNPIVFTNYGDPNLALPNFLYPTASIATNENRNVFELGGVTNIIIDGLQFNDNRGSFSIQDKVNPAPTRSGIWLGTNTFGTWIDTTIIERKVKDCIVRNCVFNNISFAIGSLAGIRCEIYNNTITNLKACVDTIGVNDVGAGAFEGLNGYFNRIHHNYVRGAWAKSGRISSSNGLLGVGCDIFNLKYSSISYNTFVDCSGAYEIGNIDVADANAGAQYDTFAYNKVINCGQLGYIHGESNDPFGGKVRNIFNWNNVIINNNTSRINGQNFGWDLYNDGQSFRGNSLGQYAWWFFRSPTKCPDNALPESNQTWSNPINPSWCNWSGHKFNIQYSSDNFVGNPDTIVDMRNNIFYCTTGDQIIYDASRTKQKHSNNIYYLKGGFLFPTSLGGTLGFNERIFTTKFFKDTSAALPENWDLRIDSATSLAVTGGASIPGFSTDFAGNPIIGIRTMGIYQFASGAITPSVTTLAATSISYTTALIGGNITSDGGAPILRSGLMYSTIPLGTDTISGVKVINPVLGTGVYTSPITGLTSSTTYYVRAFAVNNIGITFGANVSFITLTPPTLATVITSPATSITISAATLGGNVTLDGGASVTRRGVIYSTSVISDTNSITGGGRLASGTGTGIYTIPVTGLAINTLYHVRAFVVNSVGVYLAPEVTFTTLNIPTLTTLAATSITSSSAMSGGNITSDGGFPVIRRGIVWNVFPISDTGTNPRAIDANGGIGTFNLSVPTPVFRTYYVLAFAVNANGVAYGNLIQFQSLLAALPSVAWAGVNLGVVTSVVNGNVASEGSAPVTRRGFIYSLTTPLPADTNSGIKVIATGGGLGAFQATLTGLTALTTYYIRPFAVNAVGVSFDAETSFRTQGASSVTTTPPTAITATSATTGGVITDYGSTFVVKRQLIYSTSPIVDTNSTVGGGTLSYTPNITAYPILLTSLLPNTTYYIAAFVVNALNFLTIGNRLSFTTLQLLSIPTVTTNVVTSITPTSANVGGNVTSDGNSAVTRRGILYSTSPLGDTTTGTKIISGTAGTGSYTIPLSSLTSNTIYYTRAFAVNSIGVAYGDNVAFVTPLPLSTPSIVTIPPSSIGITTASSGGNITFDGNSAVTRRGLIYSTSAITDTNSVTGGGRIISGTTGTGTYTSSLTGLTGNTLYYIAAFAVNSIGVTIANLITFTTLPAPTAPLVTTLPATFITISTAVIGGNVTSDGNSTVTRRGLVYSTIYPISDTNSVVGGKLIISGSGLGTYNASLSSLTSNTTYYVKAFALNSVGITYGNEVNFATPVFTPRFSNFRARKKYIQKP